MILKLKINRKINYLKGEYNHFQKKLLVISIILLVILSQLTITLYLPSMPNMVVYFKTNNSSIQLSLTLYLAGYGLSQFFYGPLSDIYGRRSIILVGLNVFIIGSLLAVLSTSLFVFLFSRVLQGIGMGCGDTMGRAILCDCFKSNDFVKAASFIGLAATFTPMVGPVMGGYFESFSSWRISFFFILACALSIIVYIFRNLPETKAASSSSFSKIISTYFNIFRHRTFLTFFLPGLLSFLGEVIYNIVSPFLIEQQLKWSPIAFGWFTILTLLGLLMGTFIVYLFNYRISYHRMVLIGLSTINVASFSMLMLNLLGYFNIVIIVGPMFIFMIGVGIIYPNTNLGALTPFATTAGIAGALQGGLQMFFGGILGTLLAHFHVETIFLLAVILTIFSLGILISFISLSRTLPIE